jgi:hypothetical protein
VAVVVGVIAFGIGAAVGNGGGTSSGTPNAAGSASQPASSTTEVEVTTTAATIDDTPEPSDFELTVKTLSKQCFGSAGCNITYRIQSGWDGSMTRTGPMRSSTRSAGTSRCPTNPMKRIQ